MKKLLSAFGAFFRRIAGAFRSLTPKQRQLLAMLAAVIVMGGVLALLVLPEKAADGGDEADWAEEYDEPLGDENELLIYRDTGEVERMELKNAYGSYTIVPDGDEFTILELAGVPQNTGFIRTAVYSATSLGYTTFFQLPEGCTLDEYGLAEPQATIKCYYKDGTESGFRVGNCLTENEETCYFQLDGSDTIYVSSIDSALLLGDSYWVSDNVFSVDFSAAETVISRITIDLHDGGEPLVITPHESSDKSDPFCNYRYVITGRETCAADDYVLTELVDELSWLTAYDAEVTFPTAEDIAAFGLDKPYATVTVVRDGAEHTLTLAKYNYDVLYALSDNISVIYHIDADSYQVLASLSLSTLRSADVHVRYFDAIEAFSVETGGQLYSFRTERTRMIDDSELYEYHVFCGDREIPLSAYKAMLEAFNSAVSSDSSGEDSGAEPYMTVRIKYFDSFERGSEKITYTSAGARRYICRVNGSETAAVNAMWMESFISSIISASAAE